jgi:outer membrane protein assembly factor BamB
VLKRCVRSLALPWVRATLMAGAAVVGAASAPGGDWPQWRGPTFDGASSETNLPESWSATQNVRWSVSPPGPGASTPVVYGDHVYITSYLWKSNGLRASCLDADSGTELWHADAGPGFPSKSGNTAASPSAVADRQRVIFYFGSGALVALDHGGKELWRRELSREYGALGTKFGYSSSPLLYAERLFIPILRNNGEPSLVVCLDPASGRTLWSRERRTTAVEESHDAYTTPCPFEGAAGPLIIVAGGDCITAQDPGSGREVWRSADINPEREVLFRLIPSPVCAGSNVICSVNRGALLLSITGEGAGQRRPQDWAWTLKEKASDVCSPLVYRGRLYVLDGVRRIMTCLDPATGAVQWSGALGGRGNFFASPTAADGRIYCISLAGEVQVLAAGPALEVLRRVELQDTGSGASVTIARGSLYIRTQHRLFCVRK